MEAKFGGERGGFLARLNSTVSLRKQGPITTGVDAGGGLTHCSNEIAAAVVGFLLSQGTTREGAKNAASREKRPCGVKDGLVGLLLAPPMMDASGRNIWSRGSILPLLSTGGGAGDFRLRAVEIG